MANLESSTATGPAKRALDPAGEATLELFRENDAYSELLLDRLLALAPRALSGRFLEVGCGIGNLTRILLRRPGLTYLRAIDIDPAYVERVKREVSDPRLEVTVSRAEEFCPAELSGNAGQFDAIICSNVLEHIEDHVQVLRNFRRMLRPGGVALILVPAHPSLYCGLDKNLSHFRRYQKHDFHEISAQADLEVLRLRHFNPIGAFGWWLNGKLMRRKELPGGQLGLYTRFAIPLSRLVDRLNPLPIGVSLLCALGRRSAEGPAVGSP